MEVKKTVAIINIRDRKRELFNSLLSLKNLSKDEREEMKKHNRLILDELDQLEKYDRKVVAI